MGVMTIYQLSTNTIAIITSKTRIITISIVNICTGMLLCQILCTNTLFLCQGLLWL